MFRAGCRQQAIMLGLDRFYTAKPCLRGHVCERYVSGGKCIECHRERNKNTKVREKKREASQRYRAKHPERVRECLRRSYAKRCRAKADA